MYAMNKVLSRMAWAYHHKTSQLFVKSIGWLDMLKGALESGEGDPKELLAQLTGYVKDLQVKTRTFLEDVPDYVASKRVDIADEIASAIREFDPDASVLAGDVEISFERPKKPMHVFASHMLREHVYNVVRNSCDAIRDRLGAKEIDRGHVTVTLSRERVADANDRETSTPQIVLRVSDNGGGVPEELMPEIVKCGYTTKKAKGGTGCGLTAAIDYMREVGGRLDLENTHGTGLTVEMAFQEFAPDYHQALIDRHKQKGESHDRQAKDSDR